MLAAIPVIGGAGIFLLRFLRLDTALTYRDSLTLYIVLQPLSLKQGKYWYC